MKKYGLTYQVVDFVSKLIPCKRSLDVSSAEFIHSVMEFLRQLGQLQEANPRITMSFHARDGLWIYCDGAAKLFLKPTQKYLLLHIFEKNQVFVDVSNAKDIFTCHRAVKYAAGLWEIEKPGLGWLIKYFQKSWQPSKLSPKIKSAPHPRFIPGDIRQYALTEFNNKGRICLGVAGIKDKHNVEKNMQIEFDHILPYAEGGANTYMNVQILCSDCNRIKSATAK